MDCYCCNCYSSCLDDCCGLMEAVENYREMNQVDRNVVKIKILLILLLLLCIPSVFTTYLGIFYTVLAVIAVAIGEYGVSNLQKGATIVYCSVSELCFFLASYNMFEFMVDDSSWLHFPKWAKVLVLICYGVWSIGTLYCIKISLDLFKDPEKNQLLLDIEISDKPVYHTFDDNSSSSSSSNYNSVPSSGPPRD